MGRAELWVNDADNPHLVALYEEGQLVECFTATDDGLYLGALVTARVVQIFAGQRRAECQLETGQKISFRLQARPYPKAGDLLALTVSALPRQHKPLQAEPGFSRAGRLVILHHNKDGVRASHKAKDVDERLLEDVARLLPAGWGAVIKRAGLDASVEAIAAEIALLLSPLEALALPIVPEAAAIHYHGDAPLIAAQISANGAAEIKSITDKTDWHELLDKLEAASQQEVLLAGGIKLIVEHTQALTSIDIDSGASRLSPKEMARRIAPPLMAHIRLASLSGIVLVDMPRLEGDDMARLLDEMRACARLDKRHPQILGVSRAGLIELVIRHQNPLLKDRLAGLSSRAG